MITLPSIASRRMRLGLPTSSLPSGVIVAALMPKPASRIAPRGGHDDVVRGAPPVVEREVVVLELDVDLSNVWVENPDGLFEQLLAGLVAFQHDDADVRHSPSGLYPRDLMSELKCSWCGEPIEPEDGYRLAEPAGARIAAFCRLEHVVPWALRGPHWEPGELDHEPDPELGEHLRPLRRADRRRARDPGAPPRPVPDRRRLLLRPARGGLGEGRRPLALAPRARARPAGSPARCAPGSRRSRRRPSRPRATAVRARRAWPPARARAAPSSRPGRWCPGWPSGCGTRPDAADCRPSRRRSRCRRRRACRRAARCGAARCARPRGRAAASAARRGSGGRSAHGSAGRRWCARAMSRRNSGHERSASRR